MDEAAGSTRSKACESQADSTAWSVDKVAFLDSKGRMRPAPPYAGPVADTHAHLQMLDDPILALARCAWHGVDFICSVVDPPEGAETYDQLDGWLERAQVLLDSWVAAESAADASADDDADTDAAAGVVSAPRIPHVRLIVGVHPHNAKYFTASCERELIGLAADPRTAAIGEIGLDYHYDFSPRDVQREVFERQLALADEMGLPVQLHLREAHTDALDILREVGVPKAGCIVHCFNRDFALLAPFLELGCHIAFGGPLTFKKSMDVREAATHVPLDMLLTETDCPYMTPEPCRGTKCRPDHTVFTAQRLFEVCAAANIAVVDKGAFLATLYENALAMLDHAPSDWQADPQLQAQTLAAACGVLSDDESMRLVATMPRDED